MVKVKNQCSICIIQPMIRSSLVAQLVKNLPAIWDTWVQSLGWEDPLEKGKSTHSSVMTWRMPMDYTVTKSQTRLSDLHFIFNNNP